MPRLVAGASDLGRVRDVAKGLVGCSHGKHLGRSGCEDFLDGNLETRTAKELRARKGG